MIFKHPGTMDQIATVDRRLVGILEALDRTFGGIVVTRLIHPREPHASGRAADIRTKDRPPGEVADMLQYLNAYYPSPFRRHPTAILEVVADSKVRSFPERCHVWILVRPPGKASGEHIHLQVPTCSTDWKEILHGEP